ncbi:T9SS type A sorting domain-containing protein [Aequorivita sp. SDUM287046]|uniref:T9SS type A sorting domain-containing protein n=1 Tax=Aequorivita aurantiaca TaxID=3053356 RepID=A0ABT8DIC1_9FLAO|nr:T9SS type A sorting domain-containing protein [Aequorivita aurantiaca]MDN3725088.1 T9SS type A sorting domain-containing protein [Aequorivita aurantiaca]
MKMKLLTFIFCLFAFISFSQQYGSYEIDANGKLFYTATAIHPTDSPENNSGPSVLELDWSNPDFNVSNNPTKDSWEVRLAVGNGGNAYVVYNDNHSNGLQKIMFRKKVVGQEWTAPIFVDTGGEIGGRNNHYPAIAASTNGDLHVVYNVWAMENVRNYIGYSYYNSATDSWSDGLKISDLGGTVNHTQSHHDIYSTDDNLPVVVWGYDFRENNTNEEIYMTYFDGSNWSNDTAVSDVADNLNAGYPYIKSIGDNMAMIVYAEGAFGSMELRYRIYDETTHSLSPAKAITSNNIMSNNYVLATSGTGEVMVMTIHKAVAPDRDVLQMYDYDHASDSFSLSSNSYEMAANAGGLLKRIDLDCNEDGECGIVFTDFLAQINTFLDYYPTTGFGSPTIINQENPGLDAPSARFDTDGNLHVVWSDYRFDDGQGFDEREIFYEKGINTNLSTATNSIGNISVYPNPSDGIFTVAIDSPCTLEIVDILGKRIGIQSLTGTTQVATSLAPGTYFLRFSNEKGTEVKKLLVK